MLGFERVLGIGPFFRLHSNKKSWMEIVILSTQVAFTEDLINFYTIFKMIDFAFYSTLIYNQASSIFKETFIGIHSF